MSIWHHLEIEATNDIKKIKRAYAKKLKQTQPDENPVAFQQLHGAYKAAIKQAKYYKQCELENAESPEDETDVEKSNAKEVHEGEGHTERDHGEKGFEEKSFEEEYYKETRYEENTDKENDNLTVITHKTISNATIEKDSDYSLVDEANTQNINHQPILALDENLSYLEKQKVLQQIIELLSTSKRKISKVSSWKFVQHSRYIVDSSFNWQLGFDTFSLIIEHNKNEEENNTHNLVTPNVVQYLDTLFAWEDNWRELQQKFGDNATDSILSKLTQDTSKSHEELEGVRGGEHIFVDQTQTSNNEKTINYHHGNTILRVIASLVDMIIVALFIQLTSTYIDLALISLDFAGAADHKLHILAITHVLMTSIFQASKKQATPGMMLLNLKVVDKSYNRLTYSRSYSRSILFVLSCYLGIITLAINLFLGPIKIHDKISGTIVINKKTS